MTEQELKQKIEETEKTLDHLKKRLTEKKNKVLYDKMESNVGKCFRKTRTAMGETMLMKVIGARKADESYVVLSVHQTLLLIGYYSVSVTYGPYGYLFLNEDDWKEIGEEDFVKQSNKIIELGTKHLKDSERL